MLRGLPPIAFLATLVLACSAQPTATEPDADTQVAAFKKGGGNPGGGENPGSSEYTYQFTGDVSTDAGGVATTNVGKGDAESVVLDGCCDPAQETLTLAAALLSQLDPGGQCFLTDNDFSGALWRDSKDVSKVEATFYFWGWGTDGAEVHYLLSLNGTVDADATTDDGIFPPEPGESTRIVFTQGTMETEGKGKGRGGKACIGDVAVNASVTLEGIS